MTAATICRWKPEDLSQGMADGGRWVVWERRERGVRGGTVVCEGRLKMDDAGTEDAAREANEQRGIRVRNERHTDWTRVGGDA